MDVIVIETFSGTRKYRVNDAADTKDAVRQISSRQHDPAPALPGNITVIEDGQQDTVQHQTQPAPARPANPAAPAIPAA